MIRHLIARVIKKKDLAKARRVSFWPQMAGRTGIVSIMIAVLAITNSWHKPTIATQPAKLLAPASSSNTPDTPPAPTVGKDFSLIIPKIKVAIPVVADVNGAIQDDYLLALENGVAQLRGAAKPDEPGNVFIFGHSSDWRWHKGNYKKAFANLPDLNVGDDIFVWYKNIAYYYRVSEVHIVGADDVSWVAPTGKSYLTLSTCYPVGSDSKRLIVRAEFVSKGDPAEFLVKN